MENKHYQSDIELARTLSSLFKRVTEYELKHPEYEKTLRNILFGVNGDMASRMRKVGEDIINNAKIGYHHLDSNSPIKFIDYLFEGDPRPEIIFSRLNNQGERAIMRICSPNFLTRR